MGDLVKKYIEAHRHKIHYPPTEDSYLRALESSAQEPGMTWGWRLLWLGVAFTIIYITLSTFRSDEANLSSKRAYRSLYERVAKKFEPLNYHTERARSYEAEQSYEMAIGEYQKILEINPEDSVAHSRLGALYHRIGKLDQAISETKDILGIDPNNWVQREILADLYYEQGRYNLAIREYEKVVLINSHNALAHTLLGRAHYKNGDYRDAIWAYKESIGINPNLGEAHFGLGLCYLAKEDTEGAIREKQILEDLDKELASHLSKAIENTQPTEEIAESS